MTNQLFYGDCLGVLRDLADDRDFPGVDLIYLDPPFNSKRDYSILFKGPKGNESDAQIEAFEDTWHWGMQAEEEFAELLSQPNTYVTTMMVALREFLGENDMMAYLVMMANRLLVMHEVLKDTGSLYLHCDPTASHYLKIVLDGVFGAVNFRNEIVWKRTSAHSSAVRYGAVHDIILFYSKTDVFTWNTQYQPYDETYLDQFYTHYDPDGRRWRRSDLTGAGTTKGETSKVWRGIDVNSKGRHWAYTPDKLEELDRQNRIHWPKREGGIPMLKRYLDEQPGVALQDVWNDISPLHNLSSERLGYPTQKPQSLLERIVYASSNEGDIVLDPFCGCGTAVHAAEKLGRKWIGVDITHLAISLIEKRLTDAFPDIKYEVHGTPKDLGGARDLARRDKYQFEWWACSLVGAAPSGGKKKGSDKGIDGLIWFQDEAKKTKKIIVSVKGGENVGVGMIRDLVGTVEREKAQIGLFVTLKEPTSHMVKEAAAAGFYESPHLSRKYTKIQILTIEELMHGTKRPEYPDFSGGQTFKKAKKESGKTDEQEEMF